MGSRQYGKVSRLFSKWQDYRQIFLVVFFVIFAYNGTLQSGPARD